MDSIMYTEGPASKCIIKLDWKPKTKSMQRDLLVCLLFAFGKRRCYYINQRTFNSCHVITVPTLSSPNTAIKDFVYNMFEIKTIL